MAQVLGVNEEQVNEEFAEQEIEATARVHAQPLLRSTQLYFINK